jgi:hypothetical protein
MHLEILVEEQSARTALEPLLAKMLGPYSTPHTWRIHKHQGVGSLPGAAALGDLPDRKNRTLLHNLPSRLRAYRNVPNAQDAVVVLVDLDDKDCAEFERSLVMVADECASDLRVLFRFAIEELEAWFLGDRAAILTAHPTTETAVLDGYEQDSICNTWELLADAVFLGGVRALKGKGRSAPVEQKRLWARDIAPLMDVDHNASPSFRTFREGLKKLAGG